MGRHQSPTCVGHMRWGGGRTCKHRTWRLRLKITLTCGSYMSVVEGRGTNIILRRGACVACVVPCVCVPRNKKKKKEPSVDNPNDGVQVSAIHYNGKYVNRPVKERQMPRPLPLPLALRPSPLPSPNPTQIRALPNFCGVRPSSAGAASFRQPRRAQVLLPRRVFRFLCRIRVGKGELSCWIKVRLLFFVCEVSSVASIYIKR
jgi:hypothetical protein